MPKTPPFHLVMDASPSPLIDAVKAGKAKAALRHRRTSQLKTLLHALEAFAALLVLLSWCSGGAIDSAVDRSLRLLHLFRKPLPVFLLSNGIIVVIVLLSGTNGQKQSTGKTPDFSDRVYDEYLSRRGAAQLVTAVIPPAAEKSPEEKPVNNLQIVPYGNSKACAGAAKEGEIRDYRRTRSALAVRSSRDEGGRKLRRSMTEKGRGDQARRLQARRSVDDLSDEEFNRTVEKYIARTRCLLQREIMAENSTVVPRGRQSSRSMAVTVRN